MWQALRKLYRGAVVPRPNRPMVDRVLLDVLDSVLEEQSERLAPIVVLHGPDVETLSATAIWWAQCHGRAFAGGAFYLNVDRFRTESGTDSFAMLAALLRALGVPRRDRRGELYELRRALVVNTSAQPVLLLLDNVREPAQVVMSVPQALGSVVLVTSRYAHKELTFDMARFVHLDGARYVYVDEERIEISD